MADVRSLLRNERANRRITHPHLTYSTTGTLSCLVCHIQIKTEALWSKHLLSTQHVSNAQKTRDSIAANALEGSTSFKSSKKRKADDESSDEDSRKRNKGGQRMRSSGSASPSTKRNGNPLDDRIDAERETQEVAATDPDPSGNGVPLENPPEPAYHPSKQPPDPNTAVDEDEWAAFQREIASPPPEPSAFTSAADISAAPMTAAELAAQSHEQASRQAKERIEAEVEGEKEDAARQLEEEFEDMAELEDRVRRLKEKREKLRVRTGEGAGEDGAVVEEETRPPEVVGNGYASDEASSEDDEDQWGAW
ncbi:MAG: hypothetical protein Q9216_002766 [Gyalolechia sp. 2 TL-2023]